TSTAAAWATRTCTTTSICRRSSPAAARGRSRARVISSTPSRRRLPTCTSRCWSVPASAWTHLPTAGAGWTNCCRCEVNVKRLALCAVVLFLVIPRLSAQTPAALANAAEKANWTQVRSLLKQRAEVNAPQADGMTALLWATYHDDQEIVDLLIHAGA